MAEPSVKSRVIPVWEPLLDGNEEAYVLDCVRSGWISSEGKYVRGFEEAMSRSCGAAHGVACSSGTTAIHLALTALGIGPGDEVIVPCFNLIVGVTAVMWCGARAVLVDSDPDTWCLDAARFEERITRRTKAILAVHMYGHPCDMDAILAVARRHDLRVVEDVAEAHGALYKGRPVGALGDAGCYSFYGNKILTTGEGGMVVTNDPALAARLRLLRNQAFEEPRFVHRVVGYNYRLSNLQSAVGLAQCERLEHKVARKREIAAWYSEALAGEAGLQLPAEAPWARSVYWMYGVVLPAGRDGARNEVMRRLKAAGIETRPFFHPMHLQPVFQSGDDARYPDVHGSYPVAERLGRDGLYLPSSLTLTREDVQFISEALSRVRREL